MTNEARADVRYRTLNNWATCHFRHFLGMMLCGAILIIKGAIVHQTLNPNHPPKSFNARSLCSETQGLPRFSNLVFVGSFLEESTDQQCQKSIITALRGPLTVSVIGSAGLP